MRKSALALALLALSCSVVASAQLHKAGLYETTTKMEITVSPFPQMPVGTNNPIASPHTSQVCIPQAYIDKYNGIMQPPSNGQQSCQTTSINKTANGFTGTMACTGRTPGSATMDFTWPEPNHSTGTVHFTGQMQLGQQAKPFEYIMHVSSTFKSSDCGTVKPIDVPAK